jgi:hypothetical protein
LWQGVFSEGSTHAVLVAGSSGFGNYRHQADICAAQLTLRRNGVPADQIITFAYDDIANNEENAFRGQVFNRPGNATLDVYRDCSIDYSGTAVTPGNFLAVLRGDRDAVVGGNGRVLQSGPNDDLFINLVDHGAVGLFAFPAGQNLYANEFLEALTYLHEKRRYRRMVIYLEACESGSMFEGLLPDDLGIMAVTASNSAESSWGTYCPPTFDLVHGVHMRTCLGDLFSVNWLEDAQRGSMRKRMETLGHQYKLVVSRTTRSHVSRFGDLSFDHWLVESFLGNRVPDPARAPRIDGSDRAGDESAPAASLPQGFSLRGPGIAVPNADLLTDAHRDHFPGDGDDLPPGATDGPDQALMDHELLAVAKAASDVSRMATLKSYPHRIVGAKTESLRKRLEREFEGELVSKRRFDLAFGNISSVHFDFGEGVDGAERLLTETSVRITHWACYKSMIDFLQRESACGQFTDYSLRYAKIVAHLCEESEGTQEGPREILHRACNWGRDKALAISKLLPRLQLRNPAAM